LSETPLGTYIWGKTRGEYSKREGGTEIKLNLKVFERCWNDMYPRCIGGETEFQISLEGEIGGYKKPTGGEGERRSRLIKKTSNKKYQLKKTKGLWERGRKIYALCPRGGENE